MSLEGGVPYPRQVSYLIIFTSDVDEYEYVYNQNDSLENELI